MSQTDASTDPGLYFCIYVAHHDGTSACEMRRFIDADAAHSYGMSLMTDPCDRVEVKPDAEMRRIDVLLRKAEPLAIQCGLDHAARMKERLSLTLCWQCSKEYPIANAQCPHCGAINGNADLGGAQAQLERLAQ